ncbi:MAG: hypothetical protein RR228_01110 [Bacilli bacterium]
MNYNNYIKIPTTLLSNVYVSSSAKLLYGLLILLSHQEDYYYANKTYSSDKLNLETRTIARLLKELSDNNYIRIEFKHKFIGKIFLANEVHSPMGLVNNG